MISLKKSINIIEFHFLLISFNLRECNQVVWAPVEGAYSKDIPEKYRVRFPKETTFDQCICL